MDPVSNVVKLNVHADHLREVIDILEQKVRQPAASSRRQWLTKCTLQGNQIASLYDLLTFKDKPISESVVPEKSTGTRSAPPTYGPSQGRAHVRRFPTS